MKSAADAAVLRGDDSPAGAAAGMQNGTAAGASLNPSGAQPEAGSGPAAMAAPPTDGQGSGGSGGRQSATEQEQQVGAEHEALAAKLNALGGLVAKFGVALPQVPI